VSVIATQQLHDFVGRQVKILRRGPGDASDEQLALRRLAGRALLELAQRDDVAVLAETWPDFGEAVTIADD